jgi:hypothetical protein
MKKPTTTLQDVQRIIEDQDRDLEAAYRTLVEESGGRAIALPAAALDRLRNACSAQPISGAAAELSTGIRC